MQSKGKSSVDTLLNKLQDLPCKGYVLIDKSIDQQDLYENSRYLLDDPHIHKHYKNLPIQCILRILPPNNENFQTKNSDSFHISAQNTDCGYLLKPSQRSSSFECPQSIFLSRNKKINVYPCKPQFYSIKVGFKGVKTIWACFRDGHILS